MVRHFKVLMLALFMGSSILAAGTFGSFFPGHHYQRTHKIVIHVDSKGAKTQKIVLKNVTNLVKSYGEDHVKIEVVAYGPGLSLLMNGKPNSATVQAMAAEDYIRFSACNNTIQKIIRETGQAPDLIDGVVVVPSGAARIIDLEEDGYVYIKP